MDNAHFKKRITKRQMALYIRTWLKYVKARGWSGMPKAELDGARQGLRKRVLGVEISAREMTNSQLDLVLKEMWAVTNPESVTKQVRQINMSRTRAEWTITHFPETFPGGAEAGQAYVQTILDERFGGRDLMRLSDDEAAKLAMTLNMRRRSLAKRPQAACVPAADPLQPA